MDKYASENKVGGWLLATTLFYLITIFLCHYGEDKLLGDLPSSTPEAKWISRIQWGQIAIVGASSLIDWYAIAMFY